MGPATRLRVLGGALLALAVLAAASGVDARTRAPHADDGAPERPAAGRGAAPRAERAPAPSAAERRQLQAGFPGTSAQLSAQQRLKQQMKQLQRMKHQHGGGGGGGGGELGAWNQQAMMSARWQQAARARLAGGQGLPPGFPMGAFPGAPGGGAHGAGPGVAGAAAAAGSGKFARTSKHGGNRSSTATLLQRRKPWAGINASQVAAIMCMGDSWMTGLNAAQFGHLWELSKVIIDYRGGAWACGGGELGMGLPRMDTFGTLMRRYNRKLLGPASGHTPRFDPCVGRQRECGLNAAADGASLPDTSPNQGVEKLERPNTLYAQAEDISKWIHEAYPASLGQWKVLTLLASWGDQWWTPRDIKLLKAQLWKLLTFLKAQLPHTYVNLLALSDEPHTLEDVQAESMWCRTQVTAWKQKVAMASGTKFNDMNGADEFAAQLNAMLLEASEAFDSPSEHFVVRFQPLLRGFRFQRRVGDPFTCFHPSRELTKELALGLLQNMAAPSTRQAVADLNFFHPDKAGTDSPVMAAFRKYVTSGQDVKLL